MLDRRRAGRATYPQSMYHVPSGDELLLNLPHISVHDTLPYGPQGAAASATSRELQATQTTTTLSQLKATTGTNYLYL